MHYLQYFLGLYEFHEKPLFDPSMMVHFRARFTAATHQRINEAVIERASPRGSGSNNSNDGDEDGPPSNGGSANGGKLLIHATCTPAQLTAFSTSACWSFTKCIANRASCIGSEHTASLIGS